jgi:hypothetical protein
MDTVEKIAATVLYEGYLLYPYSRSTLKNQQRWTFGGVYPRQYSEATGGNDPWLMQTQCLLVGKDATELEIKIRFLQVIKRDVVENREGTWQPVAELWVEGQVYRPWEEAIEREIVFVKRKGNRRLPLNDLISASFRQEIDIPAGSSDEPLLDATGRVAGALRREWQSLRGAIEIETERLVAKQEDEAESAAPLYRLTVRIVNTTPWPHTQQARSVVLQQTFLSTHTILRVDNGAFVSLLESPEAYQEAAAGCQNLHTWPVLVGESGEQDTLLSSPIILYDYPQIAPESPGDLFDTTEIDELLTLSILTLTDAEKQEMRESDPRGRAILERTEALTEEQILKMHGVIRYLQPLRREEA